MKSARNLLVTAVLWTTKFMVGTRDATSSQARSMRVESTHEAGYTSIDAYIQAQMAQLNIPGAVLAIVEGDQIVHTHTFGRAGPYGVRLTPQTPFFVGSLAKSITASAVMQLVEAGKIELDASVQSYLPWFQVADRRVSAQMTVRHLLNQTSGLSQKVQQVMHHVARGARDDGSKTSEANRKLPPWRG